MKLVRLEAGNGRQAIEAFEPYQPDVTLMDLRIPGLNGISHRPVSGPDFRGAYR